ncbi:MAG: Lrp/AsnC family transcriptional regulator [Syntrophomonadaceae bacterium]|jgi:DNA-binding Lrp family transcriptional regulator
MINDMIDREIVKFLQGTIPLEPRPYRDLAGKLNLSEEDIVLRIQKLLDAGVIRRMGAILRHRQAGYEVNAMVVWKVEENQADEAGRIMAGFKEISHCYLRDIPEGFNYNLFTMIHVPSEEKLLAVIDKAASLSGLKDYLIIKSSRELKKVSMEYF